MSVAIVKSHNRIYIEYFLHIIILQLVLILINKHSLSKGEESEEGLNARFLILAHPLPIVLPDLQLEIFETGIQVGLN